MASLYAGLGYNNNYLYSSLKKMPSYPIPSHRIRSGNLRGSWKLSSRGSGKQKTMLPAAPSGNAKFSRGLVIGKRARKVSFQEKVYNTLYPPLQFNSKWNFTMNCSGGRMSAISIPILTKPLQRPMFDQLYRSLTTDTATADITTGTGLQLQQKVVISNYISRLTFYNSSEQSSRCRLVWYKPNDNLEENTYVSHPSTAIPSTPINMLMWASTVSAAPLSAAGFVPSVGDGLTFTGVTVPGSDYFANYDHSGNPIVGTSTVGNNNSLQVARLDPTLNPGSPQVRQFIRRYYTELKTEDFMLAPGNEFSTSLTLRNRALIRGAVETDVYYYKDSTVIGVLYVLGQTVFSDVSTDYSVSTGSSQISIMRQDTCTMGVSQKKSIHRINLTKPFEIIADGSQGIINVESDVIDTVYTSNF